MNRPTPAIKNPAALAGATGKPKGKTRSYKSADYHAATELLSSWNIPPDDRDGLEVTIGGMGHIVLEQRREFMDAEVIVLYPVEAAAFLKILPDVIDAANEHRKGAT